MFVENVLFSHMHKHRCRTRANAQARLETTRLAMLELITEVEILSVQLLS